jgi:hypothetical protein
MEDLAIAPIQEVMSFGRPDTGTGLQQCYAQQLAQDTLRSGHTTTIAVIEKEWVWCRGVQHE